MWCDTCQQDVPGIAHAASGRIVCARCQQPMRGKQPADAARICDDGIALDDPAAATAAAALPRIDDWSTRQRARHLGRELRRSGIATTKSTDNFSRSARRFDPPQDLFDTLEAATMPGFSAITTPSTLRAGSQPRRSEAGQVIAWLVVAAGALTLAGGLGLIAWSLSAGQMIYWNLALGLTLGGQSTLIFGLALVVSRLWRNSRYASGKLQDVHTRLGQLQHTADALTAMRSGGAPAFYAELVRGASPQVLLANLKGQLDQLATRLGGNL